MIQLEFELVYTQKAGGGGGKGGRERGRPERVVFELHLCDCMFKSECVGCICFLCHSGSQSVGRDSFGG